MREYSAYPFPITLDPSDNPGDCYTNGDKITGSVRLLQAPNLSIDHVSIHFKGKIKCRVDTGSGKDRHTHRSKAILFHFCTNFPLSNVPSHGPESWPFSFEFPWVALPAIMPKPFPAHEQFAGSPGHQLPPSFHTRDQYQIVSYYLEVVAHDKSALFRATVKNRLRISFAPSRPLLQPPLNLFPRNAQLSCISRKLDSVLAEAAQHLTFRQKTRRFLSNDEVLPISRFVVKSSVPCQTYAGSPLPIMIGIDHDLARSTSPEVPTIFLCSIHVRISVFTQARVPVRLLFGDMGNHIHKYKEKVQIVNFAPAMALSEEMHLEEYLPRLGIPLDLPPTFKSYNLSRHYNLKVTAVLSCVDQKYDVQMTGDLGGMNLEVLPAIYKAWVSDVAQQDVAAEPLNTEEQLPLYQRTDPLRLEVF